MIWTDEKNGTIGHAARALYQDALRITSGGNQAFCPLEKDIDRAASVAPLSRGSPAETRGGGATMWVSVRKFAGKVTPILRTGNWFKRLPPSFYLWKKANKRIGICVTAARRLNVRTGRRQMRREQAGRGVGG